MEEKHWCIQPTDKEESIWTCKLQFIVLIAKLCDLFQSTLFHQMFYKDFTISETQEFQTYLRKRILTMMKIYKFW